MKKVLVILALVAMTGIANADLVMDGTDFAGNVPLGYVDNFHIADSSAWGSGWGVTDLRSNVVGNTLVLQTNIVNTRTDGSDPYWAPGENSMTSNGYYESGWGEFTGQNVYFDFEVLSNNLAGAIGTDGAPIVTEAFIKVLDAGATWATGESVFEPLTVGHHSIQLLNVNGTAGYAQPIVQVGFRVIAGNDTAASDNLQVVISTIPEPATMALLGLGGLFLSRRKK